jgi:hypothetical protein
MAGSPAALRLRVADVDEDHGLDEAPARERGRQLAAAVAGDGAQASRQRAVDVAEHLLLWPGGPQNRSGAAQYIPLAVIRTKYTTPSPNDFNIQGYSPAAAC